MNIFSIPYDQLRWLFAIAVTIHNLEEAVWLPKWSQQAGKLHPKASKFQFRFAVIVLTLSAYGIAHWSYWGEKGSLGDYLLTGYAFVTLLNAFFPHLVATILLRRYAPGLIAALCLNVPIMSLLLYHALQEQCVSPSGFVISTCAFTFAIIGIIPLLFRIGRYLEK
jgi:membrane protein YdbS with pleckstrin-like domain